MRGLTFSVVAPTLGLLLAIGLVAWQQCAGAQHGADPIRPQSASSVGADAPSARPGIAG